MRAVTPEHPSAPAHWSAAHTIAASRSSVHPPAVRAGAAASATEAASSAHELNLAAVQAIDPTKDLEFLVVHRRAKDGRQRSELGDVVRHVLPDRIFERISA